MKANAITRIVIFSIVILVLMAILFAGISVKYLVSSVENFDWKEGLTVYGMTDGTIASTGSVPAEDIRRLEIQWVSGSITIKPGDTDRITFSENSGLPEDQQMVWKQSGDRLQIQYQKKWVFFGLGVNTSFSRKDLVITVPRDWSCDSLSIDSVSAAVDVTDQAADGIDLENVSGRCTFTDCTAKEVSATTVSGNVSFIGSAEDFEFETVSGDCSITALAGRLPEDVQMDSVSGDLELTLPEDTGFTASLDSVSGDISTEFPTTVAHGDHTHGDGSCRINADTVSGDIIIRKG